MNTKTIHTTKSVRTYVRSGRTITYTAAYRRDSVSCSYQHKTVAAAKKAMRNGQ